MLELRLKLKEVEASVEIRKEGLEEAEEDWRSRLGEQLDVVEQLQQVNTLFCTSTSRLHKDHKDQLIFSAPCSSY